MVIKVLIIENETLVRLGIRGILMEQGDFEIVGEASTIAEGFELFQRMRSDVVLMSLRFTESCAVDEIEKFLKIVPKAKIIVVASHAGDAEISRSLKNGAFGYVCKDISASDLVKAVKTVAAGKKFIPTEIAQILSENIGQEMLTASEKRILEMIAAGNANKEIAAHLGVTENTVKTHIKNIFDKLGVSDRTSATTIALKRGLIRLDL